MKKPYEFRGHAYRALAEAEAWTRQRHEPALEPELAIIDPHHHVWDDQRGRYLTHELAADVGSGHNVVATVFVEAGVMYRADGPIELKPVGEVEFVNGIAAMATRSRLCSKRWLLPAMAVSRASAMAPSGTRATRRNSAATRCRGI